MLNLPAPDQARALRDFFRESRYTREGIEEALILVENTARQSRTLQRTLERTREPTPLNLLIRWFTLSVPVPESTARAVIPPDLLQVMVECGLLEPQAESLAPLVMLSPFNELLIATDFTLSFDNLHADTVLGINAVTWLMYRFMLARPCRSMLDLGSGCGALGLSAAAWSEQVTCTDINPRATNFEQFNARLNGTGNCEALTGNAYEPVTGRRFDSIVMNPPFYISPYSNFVFCDNEMRGDEFCRALVRSAPAFLEEGGYCQIICEWIERKSEGWQPRVQEWLDSTGCDAWVIKGHTAEAGKYSQDRIRETTAFSPEQDAVRFAEYSAYMRSLDASFIHRGLIALRRRSGRNWIKLEAPTGLPKESYGDSILAGFEAMDFIDAHRAAGTLGASRLVVSPHARLDQRLRFDQGQWKLSELHLHKARGLPYPQELQPLVTQFLNLFDASRTVDEAIAFMVQTSGAAEQQVREECLRMTSMLVERGFLIPAGT